MTWNGEFEGNLLALVYWLARMLIGGGRIDFEQMRSLWISAVCKQSLQITCHPQASSASLTWSTFRKGERVFGNCNHTPTSLTPVPGYFADGSNAIFNLGHISSFHLFSSHCMTFVACSQNLFPFVDSLLIITQPFKWLLRLEVTIQLIEFSISFVWLFVCLFVCLFVSICYMLGMQRGIIYSVFICTMYMYKYIHVYAHMHKCMCIHVHINVLANVNDLDVAMDMTTGTRWRAWAACLYSADGRRPPRPFSFYYCAHRWFIFFITPTLLRLMSVSVKWKLW